MKATDEVRRGAILKLEAFISAKIATENTPEVPKGWVNWTCTADILPTPQLLKADGPNIPKV
jgi:hypothetical protein